MKSSEEIFKKGSKTFYLASKFFPEDIRRDVARLYAFVRTADDLVDKIPQDKQGFSKLKKETQKAFASSNSGDSLINDFAHLCSEYRIDKKWVDSFLSAMEMDLYKSNYSTYEELEEYMYGSAEVIGLMMARILKLPSKSESSARAQGKAMQLINFIRDIKEDMALGRQYIPDEDLKRFGIKKLSSRVNGNSFSKLVHFELDRYRELQTQAYNGYKYIPRSSRIPIATAASLYGWTAKQIEKDPLIVFQQKVKPSKARIFSAYVRQLLRNEA